ncbi:MAG: SCO family protein [Deltaproteobacteria bacterium]|nr:SCO family protein [Deltaproteobacteria bacterium]
MKESFICCFFLCISLFIPFSNPAGEPIDASNEDEIKPLIFHESHKHHNNSSEEPGRAEMEKQIGVDERLGQKINLDIMFRDEHQSYLKLKDFITKPTIILPVYFSCPQACSMMLASLSQAVNDVPLVPGEDYQILALSFDAEDTPEVARQAKENYFKLITKKFPRGKWRFATGRQKEIDSMMNALGYRLKKTGPRMFIHPNVLIVIAPGGQIIRYLYGMRFLPFDIGMALTEAAKGTPHMSVRRILSYCFDYDSKSKTYVFKSFRIAAISIILLLAVFLFFLLRKSRKISRSENKISPQGREK